MVQGLAVLMAHLELQTQAVAALRVQTRQCNGIDEFEEEQDLNMKELSQPANMFDPKGSSSRPLNCGTPYHHKCRYRKYRPDQGRRAVIRAQMK